MVESEEGRGWRVAVCACVVVAWGGGGVVYSGRGFVLWGFIIIILCREAQRFSVAYEYVMTYDIAIIAPSKIATEVLNTVCNEFRCR